MTVYRTGATQKISSAAVVETDYKTNATVTRQVTGATAATEVQKIAVSTLTQSVYVLTVGATILTTSSLDASPTIAELVTAIQAATGYGAAPFGVAAGTGDELVLTWESAGAVTDVAVLTKNNISAGTTTLYRAGAAGVKKAQRIPVSPLGNYVYKMVVDSVTLTTSAIGSSPTIQTLVTALKNDADYAAAPFTIKAVYPDTIFVEWKVAGVETDSAVLTYDGASAGTTTETTVGVTAATEIQEFTPVLDAGSIYRLTVGAVVLTTSALDATPTIAELNTALQADGDYAGAPFTTSVSSSKILVTWKTAVTVASVGTFDYRENIEGPYSTAIPAGVAAVRVICDAACNLEIGADAEATANSMLLPINTVEYFKVSPGDRVSFKGSTANLYVTYLYE
jgi:hypothetical protein